MNILIISESLSNNLGDQAIFKGLKSLIENQGNSVNSLDLSGRSQTPSKENTKRKSQWVNTTVLQIKNIIQSILIYTKNKSKYSKAFEACDLIIIGGGSLLINNNLSFPTKLYLLTNLEIN